MYEDEELIGGGFESLTNLTVYWCTPTLLPTFKSYTALEDGGSTILTGAAKMAPSTSLGTIARGTGQDKAFASKKTGARLEQDYNSAARGFFKHIMVKLGVEA
jgi:hypothetical protein